MRAGAAVLGALAIAFAWQAFTVHANYKGNWTALFCSGDRFATPPALGFEHVYHFANSNGYDGQFYHFIAHDPLIDRGLSSFIDAPSLRYGRILVPAMASMAALGSDARVDVSYFAVILFFAGLGTWWLALYARHFGYDPLLGLAFLLVPAVLTSLERMVIDIALAALCVGWAWYSIGEKPVALWFVLAAAALARDTGLILVAAQVIWTFRKSGFGRSSMMATSALPLVLWHYYVSLHLTASSFQSQNLFPFSGLFLRLLHPNHYPFPLPIIFAITLTDYVALGGIVAAVVLVAQSAVLRRASQIDLALYGFGVMAAFLSAPDVWTESYGFGRIFSPLLLLLLLVSLSRRQWLAALPIAMVTPSILLVYAGQIGRAIVH